MPQMLIIWTYPHFYVDTKKLKIKVIDERTLNNVVYLYKSQTYQSLSYFFSLFYSKLLTILLKIDGRRINILVISRGFMRV